MNLPAVRVHNIMPLAPLLELLHNHRNTLWEIAMIRSDDPELYSLYFGVVAASGSRQRAGGLTAIEVPRAIANRRERASLQHQQPLTASTSVRGISARMKCSKDLRHANLRHAE